MATTRVELRSGATDEEDRSPPALANGNSADSVPAPSGNMSSQRTCYTYDAEMLLHNTSYNLLYESERPQRLRAIHQHLTNAKLLERCVQLPSRLATTAELELVHAAEYIRWVDELAHMSHDAWVERERQTDGVSFNGFTPRAARLAAGCLLEVLDAVLEGRASNGFALIRVLYISLHRFDHGTYYAGPAGHESQVGTGPGEGFNVNIPWNEYQMADAEYLAAFEQIVLPIASEFNPELVLVSAGFDAAGGDPLGHFAVTPACYAHLTHSLLRLAGGRVVLALEGGYNLVAIAESFASSVASLLGDAPPQIAENKTPNEEAMNSIRRVITIQRKYWKCFAHLPVTTNETDQLMNASLTVSTLSNGLSKTANLGSWPPLSSNRADNNGFIVPAAEPDYSKLCRRGCPHLRELLAVKGQSLEERVRAAGVRVDSLCAECGNNFDSHLCLSCLEVHCSRLVRAHMPTHLFLTGHAVFLALNPFEQLLVYCRLCDELVDAPTELAPIRRALTDAH